MADVRRLRSGNDYTIIWDVLAQDGSAVDLSGKDISLFCEADGQTMQPTINVEGNRVEWTYHGYEQKNLGAHNLTIVENNGKDDMRTIDKCTAFVLVDSSCKADVTSGCTQKPRRLRIGNDYKVVWKIKAQSGDVDLSGKDLKLYYEADGERVSVSFSVEDNSIVWDFKGAEQSKLGAYRLILTENEGEDNMRTIDVCDAFVLVGYNCESDNTCEPGETETVSVISYISLIIGIKGDKGEKGEKGDAAGLTVPITASPMVINHGMDKFPSITVMAENGTGGYDDVIVGVTYTDRNTVAIEYSGEVLKGYVYLI